MRKQMDNELLKCILACNGDKFTPTEVDKVFMYVKNYCHFSKHAAGRALGVCSDVAVIDVLTGKYVSATDLKQSYAIGPDTHYIQAYPKLVNKGMSHVPQIFVHSPAGWQYIGGSDDFDRFIDRRNTSLETIQAKFDQVKL
jgi:glutaredoxin